MSGDGRFISAVRRPARLPGLAVPGLYRAIFVGDGGFNPLRLRPSESVQMALFLTVGVGLLVAWRREGRGGTMTLADILLFYLNEFWLTGRFPRGWAFAILSVPAALSLIASVADRAAKPIGGFGR
jgi:hypothetical protein